MKIAVEGCAHGELDKIYETVAALEKQNNFKVDLLICCGDFQAVRNVSDLKCMAVPEKFLQMNSFYKYYSGEKLAPVLTIFIGGNHEASNYLSELGYGGWAAPNIYYLGYAGVVKFGGVRIAGLSGIYKGYDYLKGHHECPPYVDQTKKTVYHIRNIDVFRLKQVTGDVDFGISHDWPRGIHQYGDVDSLLRVKKFFMQDIQENKLGSRPTEDLMNKIQPTYWFSAHLHVKFAAIVPHKKEDGTTKKFTKFLSLDKCLPRRKFLQIIDVERKDNSTDPPYLEYDRDWMCILRSTNHLFSAGQNTVYMPGPGCSERYNFEPTNDEREQMDEIFSSDYKIPENFVKTAEAFKETSGKLNLKSVPDAQPQLNPQTSELCQKLRITNPMAVIMEANGHDMSVTPSECHEWTFVDESERNVTLTPGNPSEISLNVSDEEEPTNASETENGEELDLESEDTGIVKRVSDEVPASSDVVSSKKFKRRNQAIYTANDDD